VGSQREGSQANWFLRNEGTLEAFIHDEGLWASWKWKLYLTPGVWAVDRWEKVVSLTCLSNLLPLTLQRQDGTRPSSWREMGWCFVMTENGKLHGVLNVKEWVEEAKKDSCNLVISPGAHASPGVGWSLLCPSL
jgi:hypothetical protein